MTLVYNEQTGEFDEVAEEPRINSFSFDGPPIRYKDESVTFRWDVRDAQRIFINDEEVPLSSSSFTYPLSSAGLRNFILKIENSGIQKTERIQLKVLETPVFNVEQSAKKLRKGKAESCTIRWDIQNAQSVKLIADGVENNSLASECTVSPEESSDYRFEAVGLDGERVFSHIVSVGVFEQSEVSFEADKNFTLPRVPIKLSWDVKNASRIELTDYGTVEQSGEKIIECDREKVFTLKVTDAFGTIEYHQRIKMYPLPLIRSILVPTPKIERNLNVETHLEQKHIQVDITVNMATIPDFNGIKADVFVPTIPFHQLEFSPKKNWWQKINEHNKLLAKHVTEKISSLWKR